MLHDYTNSTATASGTASGMNVTPAISRTTGVGIAQLEPLKSAIEGILLLLLL